MPGDAAYSPLTEGASPDGDEEAPLTAGGDPSFVDPEDEEDEDLPELMKNIPEKDWKDRLRNDTGGAITWMHSVLKDHFPPDKSDAIKDLQYETAEKAYTAFHTECLPEDLQCLVAVTTERYAWWQVYIATCFTLGLFQIFRPKDDEFVLGKTKNERVLCYKIERINWFSNLRVVFVNLIKWIFFMYVLFVVQSTILNILGIAGHSIESIAQWTNDLSFEIERRQYLKRPLIIGGAFLFVFWMWSKCPHDYGTRGRQTHAANKICAWQWTLTGGNWRRKAGMRMYFGKFPDSKTMNRVNMTSSFSAMKTIKGADLETGSQMNPFSGKSRGMFIIGLLLASSLLQALNAGFTYGYDQYSVAEMATKSTTFCNSVARNQTFCERERCEGWARVEGIRLDFCSELHWCNAHDADCTRRYCRSANDRNGPCCGDCLDAYFSTYYDSMTNIRLLISFLNDFLSIYISFYAAATVLADVDDRGYIDVVWNKVPRARSAVANFLLTQPLCNHFCNEVWASAYSDMDADLFSSRIPKQRPQAIEGIGAKLGVEVEEVEKKKLRITAINEGGSIKEWNDDNEDNGRAIAVGDVIVVVNGTRDDSKKMQQELVKAQQTTGATLNLVVYRQDTGAPATNMNNTSSGKKRAALVRSHRAFEDMEGDRDANLNDLHHFKTFPKYWDWEEFHKGRQSSLFSKIDPKDELEPKKLIAPNYDEHGKADEFEFISIPSRVIGLLYGEKIYGAWDELPQMTFAMALPVVGYSGLLWFLLAWYHEAEGTMFNFMGDKYEFLTDGFWSLGVMILSLFIMYVYNKLRARHVIVITDRRFIEIRFRDICRLCCAWTIQLRVDIYRHDHNLTYGSFRTTPPSIYARYKEHVGKGPRWTPGKAVAQCGFFGILEMSRQRGNIVSIFQTLSQLVAGKERHVDEKDVWAAGVDWDKMKTNVGKNMERVMSDVWRINHRQPDDSMDTDELQFFPNFHMASDLELPIFYWSFKEYGPASSPVSLNTDVIITTNRMFKYSRASYKPFDCRMCIWACCWCTGLRRLMNGRKYNFRSSSFLMLDMMLTYVSEISVEPPSWLNPMRPPIRCPCSESFCKVLTEFFTFRCCSKVMKDTCSKAKFQDGGWDMTLSRGPAMAQLWMLWRHRYNGIQPDLMSVVRPLNQPEIAFIEDCYNTLGLGNANKKSAKYEDELLPKCTKQDVDKSEMLQKLMGVIQDKTHLKDAQALQARKGWWPSMFTATRKKE